LSDPPGAIAARAASAGIVLREELAQVHVLHEILEQVLVALRSLGEGDVVVALLLVPREDHRQALELARARHVGVHVAGHR
jgi:hypothetical protein